MPDINPFDNAADAVDKLQYGVNVLLILGIAVPLLIVGILLVFKNTTGKALNLATGGKVGAVAELAKAVKK